MGQDYIRISRTHFAGSEIVNSNTRLTFVHLKRYVKCILMTTLLCNTMFNIKPKLMVRWLVVLGSTAL